MRLAALALCLAATLPAAADPVSVTATVTYRERIALPPDALLLAELRDGAGRLVAALAEPVGGAQVPLPIALSADAAADVLVLRAGIAGAGPAFVTEAVVLPRGGAAASAGEMIARRAATIAPATAWRCGETLFWLAETAEGARLRKGGATAALRPVPAASGAKAEAVDDPGTWAWSKGPALTLSWRGAVLPPCVPALDPLAAGFSARGSEPGWRLELTPAGLDFAELDGPGLRLPLPAPEPVPTGRRYRTEGLTVTLEDRIARDSMSGLPFPVAVTVEAGGRTFTGTGGDPAALLEGLDWRVVEAGGRTLPAEVTATLRFEGRMVGGSGGCNRFTGSYELTGEGLGFGPAAATMMACPGAQMAAERAVFAALAATRSFDIDAEGALILLGDRGPVARLLP